LTNEKEKTILIIMKRNFIVFIIIAVLVAIAVFLLLPKKSANKPINPNTPWTVEPPGPPPSL
jgi:flagellar basal body-associated protein FliL